MIDSSQREWMGRTIQRNMNKPRIRPVTTFHKEERNLETHMGKKLFSKITFSASVINWIWKLNRLAGSINVSPFLMNLISAPSKTSPRLHVDRTSIQKYLSTHCKDTSQKKIAMFWSTYTIIDMILCTLVKKRIHNMRERNISKKISTQMFNQIYSLIWEWHVVDSITPNSYISLC